MPRAPGYSTPIRSGLCGSSAPKTVLGGMWRQDHSTSGDTYLSFSSTAARQMGFEPLSFASARKRSAESAANLTSPLSKRPLFAHSGRRLESTPAAGAVKGVGACTAEVRGSNPLSSARLSARTARVPDGQRRATVTSARRREPPIIVRIGNFRYGAGSGPS
jgi:hypothetical protein